MMVLSCHSGTEHLHHVHESEKMRACRLHRIALETCAVNRCVSFSFSFSFETAPKTDPHLRKYTAPPMRMEMMVLTEALIQVLSRKHQTFGLSFNTFSRPKSRINEKCFPKTWSKLLLSTGFALNDQLIAVKKA